MIGSFRISSFKLSYIAFLCEIYIQMNTIFYIKLAER
jgi:hypothetical protein